MKAKTVKVCVCLLLARRLLCSWASRGQSLQTVLVYSDKSAASSPMTVQLNGVSYGLPLRITRLCGIEK